VPCYYPIQAYRAKRVNPETGKRPLVFSANDGFRDLPVTVPCGRCIGCRLEYSRQWAIRCLHESSTWENNCMITLTYDEEHLPDLGTLVKKDFQDFMKRLRKRCQGFEEWTNPKTKKVEKPIRNYYCGEYGERFGRPHFHSILFNYDFPDKEYKGESKSGFPVWNSELLSNIWGKGRVEIGSVTFESAAYVARYIMKKNLGSSEESELENFQYAVWCQDTGALVGFKEPEFCNGSRCPGVAGGWFQECKSDVFPSDSIAIRGIPMKPPKFYLSQFELDAPDEVRLVKAKRKKEAKKYADNSTVDRLKTREKVKLAQLKQLPRNLE
jgi:hypothetical protein